MSSHIRDPVGTGVAALIGLALGVTFAAPMLPQQLGLEMSLSASRMTTLLILGSLGLIAIPLGAFVLYLLLFKSDQ